MPRPVNIVTTSFNLPAGLLRRAKYLARKRGGTVGELLVDLIQLEDGWDQKRDRDKKRKASLQDARQQFERTHREEAEGRK